MTWKRWTLVGVLAVTVGGCVSLYAGFQSLIARDPFHELFQEQCAVCHGEEYEGTPIGTALVGVALKHGDSVAEIEQSIIRGSPERGMPAWGDVLDEGQIRSLAILVVERRRNMPMNEFKVDDPLRIPTEALESEKHRFRLETVATGIHRLPFSIAPLPDGSMLVTEKSQGMRLISADGEVGELIRGTPEVHDDAITLLDLEYGLGWLLDVAPHPAYANNGWIYLHHTHRCNDCNEASRSSPLPVSMNRLLRGRIRDGEWVDEEVLWQADIETYSFSPDLGAGGRLCFDGDGHVFFSVGLKGTSNFDGIQDLTKPYGKIFRVSDDGSIPADNPFLGVPGALKSIWTYGHRSPQGLEFDERTGQLWGTEMGPRGGDEVNWLRPGRNYGWPLTSKGVNYDGTPVEYGRWLGIELDLASIEQPVFDMTPAPAVSSFALYRGDAFPEWEDDLIVGSLKATELYRMVRDGEQIVHSETLISGLARIRDVEIAPDGFVYLLLEHETGGQVVRLVPADSR
jgi:glucose/arabinose dehydrogenase